MKSQEHQLRMGVIGFGAAGRHHCRTIAAEVPEMRLTAVVESDPDAAGRAAAEFGVPTFATHAELIRAGLCDAVSVATPHVAHAAVAVDCLKGGLHVLCEKPLADTAGEAARMVATAARSRRTLGVVFQRRFETAVQKAVQIVREGRLGRIQRTSLVFTDFRTQSYFDCNTWRGTWIGEGGGVLLNQAPHSLDIFARLAGLPERVLGRIRTRLHRIEVEDEAEAMLTYRNGATGRIFVSTTEPYREQIEIIGEKGALVLSGTRLEIFDYGVSLRVFCRKSRDPWGRPRAAVETFEGRESAGHGAVMRDFARHIMFKEPHVGEAVSAVWSLELANAITLSHWLGREVTVPVDHRLYRKKLEETRKSSSLRRVRSVNRATDPRMRA